MHGSASIVENHSVMLFKILLFVTLSNSLANIWDINGLGATPDATYILSKLLFLALPFIFLFLYRKVEALRSYMQPAIALTFFAYSAYYMQSVHYSYFTAFIQFFIGLVLFLKFDIKGFLAIYIAGFVFLIISVDSLKGTFSALEFEQKSSDIMGATLPVYLMSILVFFLIKKQRKKKLRKIYYLEQ